MPKHKKKSESKKFEFRNPFKKKKKNKKKVAMPDEIDGTYLQTLVPQKGWRIHEDYVDVLDDGSVATILFIYDQFGKTRELEPQWGISFIRDLVSDQSEKGYKTNNIRIAFISSIDRMSPEWISKAQRDADAYLGGSAVANTRQGQAEARPRYADLNEIADSLVQANSSYLGVWLKYVVTAKDLDTLNEFLSDLKRRLDIRIPGLILTLCNGNIASQFNRLFAPPEQDDSPRRLMFTSEEFAGFYNLVTVGIEDPKGIYMGEQVADINNTAVIWDPSLISEKGHAVIASENPFRRKRDDDNGFVPATYKSWNGSDMWFNVVLSQLIRDSSEYNGSRHIFTLALDPIKLSPIMKHATTTVDLGRGLINPFEMFGELDNELEIYASNIEKWKIITRQLSQRAYKSTDDEDILDNTILATLGDVLKKFYIRQGLWVENPKENRDKLRILGIPHEEYPTLELFISYLQNEYLRYSNRITGDPAKAHDVNELLAIFTQLENTNGDLFNVTTARVFDNIGVSYHTLFDYSRLLRRQGNMLLVQMLNSISAIASKMNPGDVLIIHGAEHIEDLTKHYVHDVISELTKKNVKIIYSYNSIEDMIDNAEFSELSSADWTLFGHMTFDQVKKYDKMLGEQYNIPTQIADTIVSNRPTIYYLHRGIDNIVFDANPALDGLAI